jgi:hypothetical protein
MVKPAAREGTAVSGAAAGARTAACTSLAADRGAAASVGPTGKWAGSPPDTSAAGSASGSGAVGGAGTPGSTVPTTGSSTVPTTGSITSAAPVTSGAAAPTAVLTVVPTTVLTASVAPLKTTVEVSATALTAPVTGAAASWTEGRADESANPLTLVVAVVTREGTGVTESLTAWASEGTWSTVEVPAFPSTSTGFGSDAAALAVPAPQAREPKTSQPRASRTDRTSGRA